MKKLFIILPLALIILLFAYNAFNATSYAQTPAGTEKTSPVHFAISVDDWRENPNLTFSN